MTNPRLKRKPVAGKVGFKAADAEQANSETPPLNPPQGEEKPSEAEAQEADRVAAEQAARDQEAAAERDRAEAEARKREVAQAEKEARERAEREAEEARRKAEAAERARALQEARERAEREAREERERAEREEREAREREEDEAKPGLSEAERERLAREARNQAERDREEREQRARDAVQDDKLQLDLGQGEILTIDLVKARAIQGSDNRQRNVQVPPRIATRVRKEAVKTSNDSHVLVFFRALSKAIRDPHEFGKALAGYRNANAITDPLLGITIASGKRTRRDPVKLQYNPTKEFDELLIDLAAQLKVSKAVFVSLLLVHYYGLEADLI